MMGVNYSAIVEAILAEETAIPPNARSAVALKCERTIHIAHLNVVVQDMDGMLDLSGDNETYEYIVKTGVYATPAELNEPGTLEEEGVPPDSDFDPYANGEPAEPPSLDGD